MTEFPFKQVHSLLFNLFMYQPYLLDLMEGLMEKVKTHHSGVELQWMDIAN